MDSVSRSSKKQRLLAAIATLVDLLLEDDTPAPIASTSRRLIDRTELAEILGVSQPTLRKMVRSGRLPYVQVGDVHRYDVDEVRAALASAPRPAETIPGVIRLSRAGGGRG